MTVYGNRNMSYLERIKFVGKGYGDPYCYEEDLGYLKKFNNALGFKKLEYNYSKHVTEIESPDGYETPYSLLLMNKFFLNKENEIMTFVIENKRMEHPISQYSYDTFDMLIQFQKFLYKLFPQDIKIEFSINENVKLQDRDYVLSHFWNCISQGENVETELAIRKNLTKKDKKYILGIVQKVVSYEPEIECGLCETCFGYHPTHPYHAALINKDILKRERDEGIKYGYYKPSILKHDEYRQTQLIHKVMVFNHTGKVIEDDIEQEEN